MSIVGDLGGAVLSLLYDYRYLAMALLAAGAVVVLVVARRYHLASVARRHLVLSAVAGVAAAVLLTPVAWYLLSPIWIRTELIEPPVAAAEPPAAHATDAAVPRDAASPPASPAASVVGPVPTPTPWMATAPRSGEFHGTDDFHFGRGTATLTETAPGTWTIRLDDFSVRNGPDLYVYLSPAKRDYADGALEVARLRATDGSFNVRLPDGSDPSEMRSVLIWCKQFSHLFAWATLEG
jgi:hypothetical protein